MQVQVLLESMFTVDFGSLRNHVRNLLVMYHVEKSPAAIGCEELIVVLLAHSTTILWIEV